VFLVAFLVACFPVAPGRPIRPASKPNCATPATRLQFGIARAWNKGPEAKVWNDGVE